jgi:hypothetical protein
MGGRYIEVFAQPSSEPPRTEPAIRSPRAVAVAPAEAIVNSPRTTNLSARPRANSAQLDGAPASGAAEPHHEFIVKMRGLPFKASARDVVGFFGGAGGTQLAESAVHFGLNAHGRPTGEASVRFPSAEVRLAPTRACCGATVQSRAAQCVCHCCEPELDHAPWPTAAYARARHAFGPATCLAWLVLRPCSTR